MTDKALKMCGVCWLNDTACQCQRCSMHGKCYAGAHTRSIALATPSTHSGGIMRFAKVLLMFFSQLIAEHTGFLVFAAMGLVVL